jgi:eukaryotic-like serine/threonine-protein kinase
MGHKDVAFSETVADEVAPPVATSTSLARGSSDALGLSARSTVLPRMVRIGERIESTSGEQRFVPVRLLGRGGLGEVTLVQDRDIDRPVALKRMRADVTSEESVYRFAEEIRTVGQLEHPNIAPIHDVGIDDSGQHYFVMRYVNGETLEHIITRLAEGDPAYHRRFTFAHRTHVFFGILNAIGYAHAKGIIHRDIKPANIMVGPYGEVVVMDWGVAKKLGDVASASGSEARESGDIYQTREGSLVGTPAYMSPEQACGATAEIDVRSDVYSLSVVLYELLTLQHYLAGRTTVTELLAAIVSDSHTAATYVPNPHQPNVPAELSWFVEKGLQRDASARFQSVAEMTTGLEQVMAGVFPVQCPVTLLKNGGNRALRFLDRHPAIGLIGAFVVGMATITGLVDLVSRAL